MLALIILLNVLSAAAMWYQRRRIRMLKDLSARLDRFLGETHDNWAADQVRWQQRLNDLRNSTALIDQKARIVYAGPDAITPDYDGDGWRIIRLSRWEDLSPTTPAFSHCFACGTEQLIGIPHQCGPDRVATL